jgi:hypothetical protein
VIDPCRDSEGVRMALEELFEEDHVRARIARSLENATDETRERMLNALPPRTLSPGYYSFAFHLLGLEEQIRAGVTFAETDLAAFEVNGLIALGRARTAYRAKHPPCSACGVHQETRFSAQCCSCGVNFRKKG